MTEPTYEYVKGQGWVLCVRNPNERIFQWNNKMWRMYTADISPPRSQTWMFWSGVDLLKMDDFEFMVYAEENWGLDQKPGIYYSIHRNRQYSCNLYVFEEL